MSDTMASYRSPLQSLFFALLGRQCFLDVETLAKLHEDDRGALHTWATAKKRGPIMPLVLATAHVAGEATGDGQHCTKCGAALPRIGEPEDSQPYVAKSLIGLDCAGDQPEPARPVTKRGSKKTKKVNPEAERLEQAKEGAAIASDEEGAEA